jgi:hypothetical protein
VGAKVELGCQVSVGAKVADGAQVVVGSPVGWGDTVGSGDIVGVGGIGLATKTVAPTEPVWLGVGIGVGNKCICDSAGDVHKTDMRKLKMKFMVKRILWELTKLGIVGMLW